jgi:helix-turn-helix protein
MDHHSTTPESPSKNKIIKKRGSHSAATNKPTTNSRAQVVRECHRRCAGASGAAGSVLHALMFHQNADGYCWPLATRLQEHTKLSRNAVFVALNELESLGIIDRRMLTSRVNGRNAPTLYRIGGKVTHLPQNAARYILGNKRKPKSSRRRKGATYRKPVHRKLGDVPKTGTGVVPETGTQKYYREVAARIEAADAVAIGSFGGRDRGKRVLESVNPHHRHPPSEPTAKSDDDDSRARHNSPTAKAATKPAEPMELRKIKIEGFKSTALARIEAKYPNQFTRDYLYLAFAAFESRTDARISGPGFFVKCFENESGRADETAIETNVGAGPERTGKSERWCHYCDHNEFYHRQKLVNKLRFDRTWIDHEFVDRNSVG